MSRRGKPKLTVISGYTGEVREYETDNEADEAASIDCIDQHFDWIGRAKKNLNRKKHPGFVKVMSQPKAENSYLTSEGYQSSYGTVLLLMLEQCKYGGRVPLTKAGIGTILGFSRQTVDRAISHLSLHGLIEMGEHEGRQCIFISSDVATKGTSGLAGTKAMATRARDKAYKMGMKVLTGGKA